MSETKYYIKSTVTGSQSYESNTEDITAAGLVEWSDEIREFLKGEDDELAQYIHSDSIIYGVVTEIRVGVTIINGEMYGLTQVTANRELSDNERNELVEYLTGQFSDGWGEGVEQREFATTETTEEEEVYDDYADEYYYEEYSVNTPLYIHFWQPKGFKIEFIAGPDTNDAEEIIEVIRPKCKLIGENGNIFNLLGIARRTLTRVGLREQADEMLDRATKAESYDKALQIIMEYVEVI